MKTKKTELDVDFIGGQEALTTAEENALHDFINNLKETSKKTIHKKSKNIKRKKVIAN